MSRTALTIDQAETIALQGLAYLASEPEELERFLGLSGLDLDSLRARAGDRATLRAILEYILTDDAKVTGLCADLGINTLELHKASHILGQS